MKTMLVQFIITSTVDNVVKKDIDWSKPLHIGLDMNVDPMSACVSQLEKDKVFLIDEIVIYGSNTDEMCQEIRDRYGTKIPIIMYPDPACRQRKTSAGGRTDLSILQNAGFKVGVGGDVKSLDKEYNLIKPDYEKYQSTLNNSKNMLSFIKFLI